MLLPATFVGSDPTDTMYLGQADCDSNNDCFEDLICGQRGVGEGLPGLSLVPVEHIGNNHLMDFCLCPSDLPECL